MPHNVFIKVTSVCGIQDLFYHNLEIRKLLLKIYANIHFSGLLTYLATFAREEPDLSRESPPPRSIPSPESDPSGHQSVAPTLEATQVPSMAVASSRTPAAMASQQNPTNIVSWALSGTYDSTTPLFIDALDPRRSISKDEAIDLVARMAGAFEPDSTVCLHLNNDIMYPILSLAIYASKCRWTGTNTSNKAAELEHHFQASNTKYVITAVEHLDAVKAAVQKSGTGAEIILFADILEHPICRSPHASREFNPAHKSEEFRDLHDLLGNGTPESLLRMLKDIDPKSIATMMSTSGTTGRPKMATRTHAATVIETAAIAENEHTNKPYEVRRLFCTPIFHAFTMPEMVINSIRLGHPAYFMTRFNDTVFPAKIAEFKITETLAPPGMILRLANNPGCHAQIQSLRTIFSGGAPLIPELKAKFLGLYQDIKPRIAPSWGMTEGGWFTTFKYPEIDDTGSVGRVIPGLEVKTSATSSVKLANGHQTGELLVRGSHLMSGYLNNPEANRNAFTEDGWLRTGDIGYVAEDGKIYLVDRAKDLIKVNGWQVSPAELEDALLVSPDVKDSGVVGSGEHVHEHPLAFVVRSEGSPNVTASTLKAHLMTRLASYKVRSCEFQFIDEIPRSATGKILRNELKAMVVA